MTGGMLRQALAFATCGWPVLPCLPGEKIPATAHGYRDASTDPGQITDWFGRHPDWNLAIATGAPGPDVLDVDQHGPVGNGFAAFRRLKDAGLLDGAAVYVRTPSGGLHAYFAGSAQHCGHLPTHHLDFRSQGGYVLTPPSAVGGQPYRLLEQPGGRGALDWAAVTRLLQRQRQLSLPRPRQPRAPGRDLGHLARWVAGQGEGGPRGHCRAAPEAGTPRPVPGKGLPPGRVDAGGTRLRLRALHVMGHGPARIARALQVRTTAIAELVHGDAATVSPRLRDAVTDLYDAWWDKRAPERTRAERAAAAAARRRAIAGNWCAAAALDDDQLDVPGYRPRYGWKPAAGTGVAADVPPPARDHRRRKGA